MRLKLPLFDSLILWILFYGVESWTTTQKLKNELIASGTSCYRILLNIRRIDRVTNQHVLNIAQRKHLSEKLLSKQLRVLGHWIRRPPETTIKYALYTTNQRRNRRGRQLATYVKLMEKVTGMDNHALIPLAENREEWRRFGVGEDWHTNFWLSKVRYFTNELLYMPKCFNHLANKSL